MGRHDFLIPAGLEIESAEMEVNSLAESSFVPEAATSNLDHFDSTVDTFCATIVDLHNDRVDNAPQVFLDGLSHLFNRTESASYRPT